MAISYRVREYLVNTACGAVALALIVVIFLAARGCNRGFEKHMEQVRQSEQQRIQALKERKQKLRDYIQSNNCTVKEMTMDETIYICPDGAIIHD
jgi:hypothetical protein